MYLCCLHPSAIQLTHHTKWGKTNFSSGEIIAHSCSFTKINRPKFRVDMIIKERFSGRLKKITRF